MIKTASATLTLLLLLATPGLANSKRSVQKSKHGTLEVKIGEEVYNEGSALPRSTIALNTKVCPVFIQSARHTYNLRDGKIRLTASADVETKEPVTAVRIRALTYDVFEKLVDVGAIYSVKDLSAGGTTLKGLWDTRQVTGQMTMVMFVTEVRLADGTVWEYDPGDTKDEIEELGLEVDDENLQSWFGAPTVTHTLLRGLLP